MNKLFNITIELTEADIKQAVAEYVTRNLGETSFSINANDVTFVIQKQVDMRGESYGHKVQKATIPVKKKEG